MKKIIWAVAFSILFIFFHLLLDYFALASIAKIKITAEADKESRLTVYYSNGLTGPQFTEVNSVKSQPLKEGVKTHIALSLSNRIGRYLRIDPFSGKGSIKIYSIKILSHFGKPLRLSATDIGQNFHPDSNSSLVLHDGFVEMVSTGSDPQLILVNPLRFSNLFFGYILPVFLSILSVLVLKHLPFKSIHAIKDITHKKPSTNQNITALDGLRGFAALLVLADHTDFLYFKGLGAIGVWLFFCLSGFLLSIPFVRNPSLIKSSDYLQHYFLRRINRILPMYYFVLIVVYLLRGRLHNFIRHAVFIQGDGIYWSVPQEMFFYMILPLVFVLNFYLCRGNIKFMIVVTLGLAVFLNEYLNTDFIYIYGNGHKMSLCAGIFITGVCLSYFYHSPYIKLLQNRSRLLLDICGFSLLSIVLLSSDTILNLLFDKQINYTWVYSDIYGYIAALLLLFTIIHNGSFINKIMSFYPLRAVGIVGFSFYLLHPNVMSMIKVIFLNLTGENISSIALFISGMAGTYFFSVITYSLIERPFLIKT